MSDAEPKAGAERGGRGGFWAFWTTLPGILTGSAALLTAIVGLLTLLRGSSNEADDPRIDPAGPSAAIVEEEDGLPPRPDSASAAGVFVQGRLTMRSPDSADLETGLVGSSPSGADLYLYCSGIECILNGMSSLMAVADSAGDRPACVRVLSARRDQALDLGTLRPGQSLCLQTAEGHVGVLQVVALPGVGSIDFVFAYTLWT